MADFAFLGIEAPSDSIRRASDDLDKLAGNAKKAGAGADQYTRGADKAGKSTDRLEKELEQANKSAIRFSSAMRYVTAAMAVLGVGTAVLSLGQFVTNTVEAETVQAQLASALRSTAGAAGQTLDSLNEHAAALQATTIYGDEAINTAQGVMLTFTKIGGDVFPRATEAVLDMATALKMDLQSATIQVGKALNDPVLGITALQRAGIQFSETQKETIKRMVEMNDVAGAQTLILKELETQFGGSAEAARNTLGGAIEALKNAWGDMFELTGPASEQLRLAIEGLVTAISDPAFMAFVQMIGTYLFTAITMVTNAISMLTVAIPIVVDALMPVLPIMLATFGPAVLSMVMSLALAIGGPLITALKTFYLLLLANPIGVVVGAIAYLIMRFVDWETVIQSVIVTWGKFLHAWYSFWGDSAGKEYAISIVVNADKAVADLKDAATEMKKQVLGGFSLGGEDGGKKVGKHMNDAGDTAGGKIAEHMGNAAERAASIWESLNGKVVKPIGDALVDGGNYIANQVTGEVRKAGVNMGDTTAKYITGAGQTAGQTMGNAVAGAGQQAASSIEVAGIKVTGAMADAMSGFADKIFAMMQLAARAENITRYAAAGKDRAEAKKLRAEAEAIRRYGGTGGGGTGGGGGGGARSRNAIPNMIDSWEFDEWVRAQMGSSGFQPAGSFAAGGSFTVPPPPPGNGVDNVPMNMRLRQGEKVTVSPNQQPSEEKTEFKVINILDPGMALEALGTTKGQREFVNVFRANRDEIASILGVG